MQLRSTPAISPNDLLVGVDQGRFYIRSQANGRRVRFTSGHMLNYHSGPPLVRFLLDAANDSKASFSSFDWGQMESFEYLPRLRTGRIVLRPAQWRIGKENFSLAQWRTSWQVPRYLSLSAGDNRLILDLEQSSHAAELKAEVRNSRMASISPSRKSSLRSTNSSSTVPKAATTPSWSSPWFCVRRKRKLSPPRPPSMSPVLSRASIHPAANGSSQNSIASAIWKTTSSPDPSARWPKIASQPVGQIPGFSFATLIPNRTFASAFTAHPTCSRAASSRRFAVGRRN